MVSTSRPIRNRQFRAALALAGITQQEWAAQQGLTPGHVSRVLSGERESSRLMDKIDDFIVLHLRKHNITHNITPAA